jgi:hypothetical protein
LLFFYLKSSLKCQSSSFNTPHSLDRNLLAEGSEKEKGEVKGRERERKDINKGERGRESEGERAREKTKIK